MSIGIIHYWSYLALYDDVKNKYENDHLYLNKIIDKFNTLTIKTEKLSTNNEISLFAFRINDKERVVCTVKKHNDKECLVILEILENHQYHKSKYLNSNIKPSLVNAVTIVAATAEESNEDNSATPYPKLPKVSYAELHNKTVILRQVQQEILTQQVDSPTIFKIRGAAGSGNTTLSELLIYQQLNNSEKMTISY